MPATIYWMLVDSAQTPPPTGGVLSPSELEKFAAFRFPKRRAEWLLGRWTAKSLAHSLPEYQAVPLDQIEIHNSPEGQPLIKLTGAPTPAGCLTISHSDHLSLCALAPGPELHIGADLEQIEPRTQTFILDYFTPAECALVQAASPADRPFLATLIWSAKEAMLKALGVGLRWDTRTVEVCRLDGRLELPGGWQTLQVRQPHTPDRLWTAWWQPRPPFILTLAAFSASPAGLHSIRLVEHLPGN